MKALTICQPYAHLIMLPEDHPRKKRIENRRWLTDYRGPLLIHAGKSTKLLRVEPGECTDEEYGIAVEDMTFGAIVGMAELVDCFAFKRRVAIDGSMTDVVAEAGALDRYPWLFRHEHAEGPFCFVLEKIVRFETPVRCRGMMGLFNVPDSLTGLREARLNAVREFSRSTTVSRT